MLNCPLQFEKNLLNFGFFNYFFAESAQFEVYNSCENHFFHLTFSFFLISEEIDGFAPGVVLGTKYDKADTELGVEDADGEEPLPFSQSPPHIAI